MTSPWGELLAVIAGMVTMALCSAWETWLSRCRHRATREQTKGIPGA